MVGRRLTVTGGSEKTARAVVRQRLVEANHHARECNAPAQSFRDRRIEWRLM